MYLPQEREGHLDGELESGGGLVKGDGLDRRHHRHPDHQSGQPHRGIRILFKT